MVKRREEYLSLFTKAGRDSLKNLATESDDADMKEKLNKLPLDNECFFHKSCKNDYVTSRNSKLSKEKEKTKWHFVRDIRAEAYELVEQFVSEEIVHKEQPYFLKFLHDMFIDHLKNNDQDISNYSLKPYHLKDRLLKKFSGKINIITVNNQTLIKPYKGTIIKSLIEKHEILDSAARILNEEINKIKCNKLPVKITTKNLINGECEVPEILSKFYESVISGGSYRKKRHQKTVRLAKSFSEDIIYAVSNGRIKLSKQICLGLTLKSLTNSKKIVNIVNRYGHCCSYSALEGLETEATFTSCESSDICPDGIVRLPGLLTGVAYDNYDRFVDTSTGKDTLHDTVGIIFQIESEQASDDDNIDANISTSNDSASQSQVKHRRSFDIVGKELEPYAKRPRLLETMLPLESPLRAKAPNCESFQNINFAWMLSFYFNWPNTPMWVGFNSLLHEDKSPKQRLCYLTTINASPTNKSVVLETMNQSKIVADECGEDYMQVTYDLAIAKVALQIQSTDKGRFDNLFIHLGSFHIMMAFFKAVGKFIDNCGLTNIMVDTKMLANGSVNSFIAGKHFNRCKRLHPIMALALQILHFEKFVQEKNVELSHELKVKLMKFCKTKSSQPSFQEPELKDLFEKYIQYKKLTLNGDHGKTAQYYMQYVQLIDYYLLLNSSIRTNNFEIFVFVLPKITNLFFAFNQPNYSRYLIKYHDNLIKVDETHPGLRIQLDEGSFGVKRTKKPFSRQPIDLSLEQTINADAANKLTGISHITNSISARQRWCRSHTIRSTIISHTMDQTGLKKSQDVSADLQKSRLKQNTTKLLDFIGAIKSNINPFANNVDSEHLYNISTGEAAPTNVEDFLLHVEEHGNKQRETFIQACVNDPNKFEAPISQSKYHTFTDTISKKKVNISGKEVELRMQRDLFGQLLHISLKKELNLEKVLTYPLTPVPLSMCHLDGSICKTDKSVLMRLLEAEITSEPPEQTDVIIYDGYFMLHLMKDVPITFGNIAKKMLQTVCASTSKIIVIAYDRYIFPSIKDTEHKLRGMEQANFHIDGPNQVRKKDLSIELKNVHFKEALVQFFVDNWAEDCMAPYIDNKIIYVNAETCFKYVVSDGKVVRTEDQTLTCLAHEEADTKMIFHVCQLNVDANVTIRCSDTDVLIIMLANMSNVSSNLQICMQVGVGNNQRFINVTRLYEALGHDTSAALPAFHAFTGCDFNPSFFRKGKKRPLSIMRKSAYFTESFMQMSNPSDNRQDIFARIEEFICQVYGFKALKSVDEARIASFQKTYKLIEKDDVFRLPKKNIDGSALPPCKAELFQHFLRSCFIAEMWTHAYLKVPISATPTDYGWVEIDNKYEFTWFTGNQLPGTIKEITIQTEEGIHIFI